MFSASAISWQGMVNCAYLRRAANETAEAYVSVRFEPVDNIALPQFASLVDGGVHKLLPRAYQELKFAAAAVNPFDLTRDCAEYPVLTVAVQSNLDRLHRSDSLA